MEKFVEQTLAYDFYGELLNEHQRNVYADFVFNDMSLSEIAEEYEISRQAVHEIVKRVDKKLNDYENKLHLIKKFLYTKERVKKIHELTEQYLKDDDISYINEIHEIASDIVDNF